ncbi:amidohydrolase [Hathewaya histolytica]|uniref:Amidohydrolase family protein n=1 Tax=Hathewaya histolytica TaxID=1498 RepID=A0A4U9R776_HATHI|nr:amidohydrolase [Hathewaya histolytica]VTQ87099.1 amidohydrolase family protein [Hathewaya histolytica]
MDFLKKAQEIKELLIDTRRDFHENPELDFQLYRTSGKVKEFLEKEGIEYYECAETGICATIRGRGEKTVALRGDMDALPIIENNSCEYKSKNHGVMHACGHDAHTTMVLGAAKILNSIKDSLNGNVKLLFEPAEETTGGAKVMVKEGVVEDVDAVIGLHVEEWLEKGKIGIKKGVVNAASNPFTIKITGKGGHGAAPQYTVDPIVIASNVIINLQNIISRELPPTDAGVITIGSIHGGTAQNIIPSEVILNGIIRTVRTEHREYVKKRLVEITEGIVKPMRGKCEIEIEESYPCLYNNDEMYDILINSAEKVIGNKNIDILDAPSMGVESFAYFAMEKPSVFYYLGCRNEEKGIIYPAHSDKFNIDEDCLTIGTAIHCQAVADFLNR